MQKAILVFTKLKNSFSVYIENMEQLSVKQIQELQRFVELRNGLFDFTKYEFIINKNINFEEFTFLLKSIGLEAVFKENILIEESFPRIPFGQYKGMQYNELTDTYILWLKNNYRGVEKIYIDAEVLNRKL